MSLPECLHWPFCPGVFIAILAVMAALVTFWERPPRLVRVFFTFIFLALMWCEVWMMSKDRAAHDLAERNLRKTEQEHFDQTMGHFTDLQKLFLSSNKAQAQVVRNIHLPEESLKKRASQLSSQIFSFLTDRKVNEPLTPMPRTQEEISSHFDALVRYGTQTLALYKETFQTRVVAIHDEFARLGLRSAQLDQFYQVPTNQFGIEYVASGMGALAERLKQ